MVNRLGTRRRYKRCRSFYFRSPKTDGPLAVRFPNRTAAANLLCRLPFGRSTFARERFFYACRPLGIRWFKAVKETVRTGFKELSQPGKSGQLDGEITAFNVADGFPMHADQLSQTLLRQVGLQPGVANVSANQSEHLLICHTPSWNGYAPLWTPRIHSVKSWGISGPQPDVDSVKREQTQRLRRRSGKTYNPGKLLLAELYRFQMSQFLFPRATEPPQRAPEQKKRTEI